jgi:hypothetical protein
MQNFTRTELEELWNRATGLYDADRSSLARAIITEALDGSGGVVPALHALADDIADFIRAIETATEES